MYEIIPVPDTRNTTPNLFRVTWLDQLDECRERLGNLDDSVDCVVYRFGALSVEYANMIERFVSWYWVWYGDVLYRDIEYAINNPDDFEPSKLWLMSPFDYFELIALLLLFPLGFAGTVWIVEIRGITNPFQLPGAKCHE